jgi:hypothetical protein
MPDSRVEKVRQRWFTGDWADARPGEAEHAASRKVTEIEMAGLGVFDPEDELLIRDLAIWLQRRISHTLAAETADNRAAELLSWIREASKQ